MEEVHLTVQQRTRRGRPTLAQKENEMRILLWF